MADKPTDADIRAWLETSDAAEAFEELPKLRSPGTGLTPRA